MMPYRGGRQVGTASMGKVRQRIRNIGRWVLITITVIASLALTDYVLADIIYQQEKSIVKVSTSSASDLKKLHYWFQVLSGNWSEQDAYQRPSLAFSLTASTSILLNFGPIIALGALIARVYSFINAYQTGENMKLIQAFAEKENAEKTALLNEFGDDEVTISRIESAFAESDKHWRSLIEKVFGQKEASSFFAMLNKPLSPP